jgi:hypothetical protein
MRQESNVTNSVTSHKSLLEYRTALFSPKYVDDANVIERVQRNYIRQVYARNNLHQSIISHSFEKCQSKP